MTIKQVKKNLDLVKKFQSRPSNYMQVKYTIDALLRSLTWETAGRDDANRMIDMFKEAVNKFYDLKQWQPEYKGKYRNAKR